MKKLGTVIRYECDFVQVYLGVLHLRIRSHFGYFRHHLHQYRRYGKKSEQTGWSSIP